jgi:hypothetical protein
MVAETLNHLSAPWARTAAVTINAIAALAMIAWTLPICSFEHPLRFRGANYRDAALAGG